MNKTLEAIRKLPWVKHVDDERSLGNGVIITLHKEWEFISDPGCGTRGFDTSREALAGCRRKAVRPLQ